MPSEPYFTRDLLKFLSELRAHNNRDWFLQNKARYEARVRDPVLRFVADLAPGLRKITMCGLISPRGCARSIRTWWRMRAPSAAR